MQRRKTKKARKYLDRCDPKELFGRKSFQTFHFSQKIFGYILNKSAALKEAVLFLNIFEFKWS